MISSAACAHQHFLLDFEACNLQCLQTAAPCWPLTTAPYTACCSALARSVSGATCRLGLKRRQQQFDVVHE